MQHKCKICGKLDTNMTCFGKHGWHHVSCVFESWQEAVKHIVYVEALSGRLSDEVKRLNRIVDGFDSDKTP